MTTDHKPERVECPFCGSDDSFVERASFSGCYVVCNNCGARGPASDDETDADADATDAGECEPGEMPAVRLWNTRQPAPPVAAAESGGEVTSKELAVRARRFGSCAKCGAANGHDYTLGGVFCTNPNCTRLRLV